MLGPNNGTQITGKIPLFWAIFEKYGNNGISQIPLFIQKIYGLRVQNRDEIILS